MSAFTAVLHRVEPLLPIRSSQAMVRLAVGQPRLRTVLNRTYDALSWKQKHYFWRLFAAALGGRDGGGRHDGHWRVKFAGREIVLPLSAARIGLDWGLAVSILGHDAEVKETYAFFLQSRWRPDLFVDVGTNFGADSTLFLVHGVRTISFEPNPACHGYFEECARLNRVHPDIRDMVVGDSHEPVELLFREGETWSGSADPEIQKQLRDGAGSRLRKLAVAQTTLDDVLASEAAQRVLIKIDAEGFESRVLRGARNLLATKKPSIIFEAWPDATVRAQLFGILAESRYEIFTLPWTGEVVEPLSSADFASAIGMNFIALPAG